MIFDIRIDQGNVQITANGQVFRLGPLLGLTIDTIIQSIGNTLDFSDPDPTGVQFFILGY